jgi:Pvc16 N-terminal domain
VASYYAIAVTASAIRGLLANACPRDARNGFPGAEFRLFSAADFQPPVSIGVGGSIYLHRVAFNTSRRNLSPRTALDGTRYRPPTPVDLHFLVTAWGRTPEEQQSVLGWIIRTLQDTPVLSAGLLNRFAGDRGEVFSSNEAVEIVGEILSFQDMLNIWEIAKINQQPSVSYVARMVFLDSEVELTEAAPVQTRGFDYAKIVQ